MPQFEAVWHTCVRCSVGSEASFKSFQANGNDEELVATAILQTLEQPGSESVVQLPAFAKTMDLAGPWLLAIDGLSEMPHLCAELSRCSVMIEKPRASGPAIVKILDSLLSQTSSLKLLLTSRKRVLLGRHLVRGSLLAASEPALAKSFSIIFISRIHSSLGSRISVKGRCGPAALGTAASRPARRVPFRERGERAWCMPGSLRRPT